MYCSNCGKKQYDDATKCMYCGKRLVTGVKDSHYRCTNCKKDISRSSLFCWNCGAAFEGFSDTKNDFGRYFWILLFIGGIGLSVYRMFRTGSPGIRNLYLVGLILFLVWAIILLYISRKQWLKILYRNNAKTHIQQSQQRLAKRLSSPEELSAKQFFSNKIIAQAKKDGVPLSPAEKYMLNFSESDQTFNINDKMVAAFENETPEDEFELKIIKLIKSAYNDDIKKSKKEHSIYKEHYQNIQKGDHYIFFMIDVALSEHLSIFRKKIF